MREREARFQALFTSSYQPLQAFARRRADASEADDLVADVLAVAWRRLEDVPEEAALPWLYGVAHRTLANQRRSSARRRRLALRVASEPTPTPAGDHSMVLEALECLSHDDQEVLRLAAWEDLSAAEIAVVLDCSPNAAALRLSRARQRLRTAMTSTTPSAEPHGDHR